MNERTPEDTTASPRLRLRVRVAVQGVGFPPFTLGLAREFELDGFVRNDAERVLLEVEGARIRLARTARRSARRSRTIISSCR
jgi:acylphosphatase